MTEVEVRKLKTVTCLAQYALVTVTFGRLVETVLVFAAAVLVPDPHVNRI